MHRSPDDTDVRISSACAFPKTLRSSVKSDTDLDVVEVAGSMRIAALLEIITRRELRFAYALRALTNIEHFKSLLIDAEATFSGEAQSARKCRMLQMSPHLAQSGSRAVLIEAAIRSNLVDASSFKELENPPSILAVQGGYVVVWYDNVLGMFSDADARDVFFDSLTELCSERQLNVRWKH